MWGNNSKRVLCLVIILVMSLFFAASAFAQSLIFNGSLNPGSSQGPPAWWRSKGSNVTLETFTTGGKKDSYCRISGKEGSIVCPAYPLETWREWVKEDHEQYGDKFLFSIWARGRGTLRISFEAYALDEDGKTVSVESPGPFTVKVESDEWARYRHVVRPGAGVMPKWQLHPGVGAPEGAVDFDELSLWPAKPAEVLIVEEEELLYGTGALIEGLSFASTDASFLERSAAYAEAVKVFRAGASSLDAVLVKSLERSIAALEPYVLTPGVTTIQVTNYNEMIAMTRVLNILANKPVGKATPVVAKQAGTKSVKPYYPGKREARPGEVTITDVRSNKVRYDENEAATTTATIVNKKPTAVSGTIKAKVIVDLDTVREITSSVYLVEPGEEKKWTFSYNVGPETYGRAIEVEFVDGTGETFDKWQEYYAVAAEFFRVHQHSDQVATKYWPRDPFIFYFNQHHLFAQEPTNFGIEPFSAEVYKASNLGYVITSANRRANIAHNKQRGIATSFYVMHDFSAQMGYEQVRQHPEFVLYDENGQFAPDPIYGGYPNPMEIASPLEVGPKRKEMKIKPHLDRTYTPWQHVLANMANEDAVVWGVERIKKYAEEWGFDGVYWDGCLGVWAGYGYDGQWNVPSRKYEDYVALNARNHRLWNQILKRDNPLFGTWMNWGLEGATGEWARHHGIKIYLGSGGGDQDPLDDNVRAATDGKNVMLLDENHSLSGYSYQKLLNKRLESRDHYVQKYGASHIIGYLYVGVDINEPGPTKWGWSTWNYILSQLIATQSHVASTFIPSQRPSLQFMTRFSRFLWAPDLKALPAEEAEKVIELRTAEEVWWKRLVYKRRIENGYDLIVHLVRIPPTEEADFNWADEPAQLKGLKITADVGTAKLQKTVACRPYYFEEPQQVVQKQLTAGADTGKVTVEIPPFRYHTMLVFRVKNR